jgi:predicted MPP superfamily phosphohydrolase
MSGISDWDDRLTLWLVKPPFRDEVGRKGLIAPFAKAQPHAVRHLKFAIPGWPRFARPLRIAFLSDFHTGSHTDDIARLDRIVAEAASHAPDVVLYGGDYVNMLAFGGGRIPPRVIARALGRLQAPLGRFGVIGNHDRSYGPDEVTQALRDTDVTMLYDATAEITHEGQAITIVGVPDARVDRPAPRELLGGLNGPSIVLTHDPVWFHDVPAGPHLTLAGHTHGGQICLPFIGPIRNASKAPMKWTYGLIEEPGKRMYVTSGLGCSGIPLRIGRPPEFVIAEVTGG